MTRRDYTPCLSAWYSARFPYRPPKTDFSDDLLAFADMVMATLERNGPIPLVFPPAPAENYETQSTVQPSARRKRPE